jgi:hypothetical protein
MMYVSRRSLAGADVIGAIAAVADHGQGCAGHDCADAGEPEQHDGGRNRRHVVISGAAATIEGATASLAGSIAIPDSASLLLEGQVDVTGAVTGDASTRLPPMWSAHDHDRLGKTHMCGIGDAESDLCDTSDPTEIAHKS